MADPTPRRPDRAGTIVVLAKEPRPGRVKTRLHPAFGPEGAARLAAAALQDTLDAVRGCAAPHRLLAWEGTADPGHSDFAVTDQPSGSLNDRLEAAFSAALRDPRRGPALLIGMDTPQVPSRWLDTDWEGADALLGLSEDGGFWAIGLRPGHPAGIFTGVPMSTDRTGSAQLARLSALGLTVALLPPLRDVDLPADAESVAYAHPRLRFSRVHDALVDARPVQPTERLFDRAYAGGGDVACDRVGSGAQPLVLEVARWSAPADLVDLLAVARCEPPVIDLGCGPGRMVRALGEAGMAALGVDISSRAVEVCLNRGGPAVRRRWDELLPGEGRWGTVLLMDGNVGLGGDVRAILSRAARLTAPGGLIVCEVDPVPQRDEVHEVVLRAGPRASEPLGWARVGSGALAAVAAALDLVLVEEWSAGGRSFVALRGPTL